ncbi:tetratricopeptide repeat protein [Chloroflexota bacterium]
MKKRAMLKVISILLVLVLLLPGVTGCGTEWEGLILELLEEWSDAHDINPSTVDGAVNLAQRTASGSTGDEEADAAIGVVKTIKDIREGDSLMAEGKQFREDGDLDLAANKMDDAIEKRPNDWTYRVSRASVAFQDGDAKTARQQMAKVHNLRPNNYFDEDGKLISVDEHIRYYNNIIDELESGTLNPASMEEDVKRQYYRELRDAYQTRMGLWLDRDRIAHDNERYEYYQDLLY